MKCNSEESVTESQNENSSSPTKRTYAAKTCNASDSSKAQPSKGCTFTLSLIWEQDRSSKEFECIEVRGTLRHSHNYQGEWNHAMQVAKKNSEILQNYVSLSALSLTKAVSLANQQCSGGVQINSATKKQLQRGATDIFESNRTKASSGISFPETISNTESFKEYVCVGHHH